MFVSTQISRPHIGEKKNFRLPHVFVLLTIVALIVALLTYFVPAGTYERVVDEVSGRTLVDASSFHYLDKTPIPPMQFITAFTRAFKNAASMIFMTLVVGGAFGIINALGIIPAVLSAVMKKFENQKFLVIPLLVLVLALFDSFMGAPELCIVFLPMILPLVLNLGWDTMTACAIVICGNCVGYSTGMGNPFTTIIAQKICELPLYSGMWYRAVCFAVFYAVAALYIMRYARKVERNPSMSRTFHNDERRRSDMKVETGIRLPHRVKLAGFFTLLCFIFNIVGVIRLGWDLAEMTGLFLVMGVGAGAISGRTLTQTCEMFMNGAREILQGALVMCCARTITILMADSNTMDMLVYVLSKLASAFPEVLAILGIFFVAMLVNFPIPSGSGEATVLVPLLSPLADILGVSKQATILAFQFGDGWSNTIYPTNASYMATLAVAGVDWTDWVVFQFPLCCLWTTLSVVMLCIAQWINLGPF